MCCDIWFLPKSKVQTGSHYYTPCCTFTHKCHWASAGPCSPVAEPERPNMRQRFLRRSLPPPSSARPSLPSSPCSLGRDSLPPSRPSLPHSRRIPPSLMLGGRLRVAQGIVGNINDKALSGGHEEGTRTSERARAASLIVRSEGCLTVTRQAWHKLKLTKAVFTMLY